MRKLALLTAATVSFAVVGAGLGSATAAADDYSGVTYGDAVAKLHDAGKKAVIASRSGDALPEKKCLVTYSEAAPWLKGSGFTHVKDTVLLHLNCNAAVATAKTPGNSAASPQGRQALKDAASKKKKS